MKMTFQKTKLLLVIVLIAILVVYYHVSLEPRPLNTINFTKVACIIDKQGKEKLVLRGMTIGSFEPAGPWEETRISNSKLQVAMQMSHFQSVLYKFSGSTIKHEVDVKNVNEVYYGQEEIWSRAVQGCSKTVNPINN